MNHITNKQKVEYTIDKDSQVDIEEKSPLEMDMQSKAVEMSHNERMIEAITMFIGFEPIFYKILEAYSQRIKGLYIPIQNTIIKRWAQDNTKKVAWENNKDLFSEFSLCSNGVINPRKPYEMIC